MEIMYPLTVKIILDKRSQDAPFVAYTPELDVASCGPTEEKARENLQEAVRIVFNEVKKKGKLEEFIILRNLKTAGISRQDYLKLLEEL